MPECTRRHVSARERRGSGFCFAKDRRGICRWDEGRSQPDTMVLQDISGNQNSHAALLVMVEYPFLKFLTSSSPVMLWMRQAAAENIEHRVPL